MRRILPYRLRRMLGPFIFMDHAGPVPLGPGLVAPPDVLPHPHIHTSTRYRRGDHATAEPAVPGWSMEVEALFPYDID